MVDATGPSAGAGHGHDGSVHDQAVGRCRDRISTVRFLLAGCYQLSGDSGWQAATGLTGLQLTFRRSSPPEQPEARLGADNPDDHARGRRAQPGLRGGP